MAVEYVSLSRDWFEHIGRMPADAIKIFLALCERQIAQQTMRVGLTLTELARLCDLGVESTSRNLDWLVTNEFIGMDTSGKTTKILVPETYTNHASYPIPYTNKNTDATKIMVAETELRRLEREYTNNVLKRGSNIASVFQGEEASLIREIEGDLGRGISPTEAYLFGKTVGSFGLPRVKTKWRTYAATAQNPIRTLYKTLWQGSMGKPMPVKEEKSPNKLPPAL